MSKHHIDHSLMHWTRRCATVFISLALLCQTRAAVDIRAEKVLSSGLKISVRNNDPTWSGLLGGLVFTIRWPQNSGVALSLLSQACPDAFYISSVGAVQSSGGYSYRTYTAFGASTIAVECPGNAWTTGEWVELCQIVVENYGGACVNYQLVNDAFTEANNLNYYVSLGGVDKTGVPVYSPVPIGNDCESDCLNVVGGSDLPGSPCDDSDPGTSGTVWSAACECVATECVRLVLHTDNAPEQTTWTINSVPPISGGPYPGQANQNIYEVVQLPTNSCYELTVSDAGGDGMCCANGTGGYYLERCSGMVIIDNVNDGAFGASSSTSCANDFCLPVDGPIFLGGGGGGFQITRELYRVPGYCYTSANSLIQAANGGPSAHYGHPANTTYGYAFQFHDPDGWPTGHQGQNVCVCGGSCSLTNVAGPFCREIYHDVNGPHAVHASGPVNERYRFVNTSGWLSNRPRRDVWLNLRVREVMDGVSSNYGPPVRVMFVTPGSRAMEDGTEGLVFTVPRLQVWPNPAGDEHVHVVLADVPESVATANITLIDATGKRVSMGRYDTEGLTDPSWAINVVSLNPGLYAVEVRVGEEVFTERLVITR